MNYAWVVNSAPKVDYYLDGLRELFRRRYGTRLVNDPTQVITLTDFAHHVAHEPSPIQDFFVGGHALLSVWNVPLTRVAFDPDDAEDMSPIETTWEGLEQTRNPNTPEAAIAIPAPVLGVDPAGALIGDHAFHIKGCALGRYKPFLKKIRQALGGRVLVTAPRFWHTVSFAGGSYYDDSDCYELMAYTFFLPSKRIIPNHRRSLNRLRRRDAVRFDAGSSTISVHAPSGRSAA